MTRVSRDGLLRDPTRRAATANRRPYLARVIDKVEDLVDELNWLHLAYKAVAYSYLAFVLWLISFILPFPSNWSRPQQSDRIPVVHQDLKNYFDQFRGFPECNIRANDLYSFPSQQQLSISDNGQGLYCHNRKSLLRSMSNGGRIGFEAPYTPRDCHYRWYSIAEICMILDRFDSLVFVGDHNLQTIYTGFNILLRQDLSTGALQTRGMSEDTLAECHCDNQFIKQSCSEFFVTSSDDISKGAGGGSGSHVKSRYACNRTPHIFLSLTTAPASAEILAKFKEKVPQVPKSNYKPIPIIYSLSPSTTSQEVAAATLLKFFGLAESSRRKTPILWIGPSAAGHVDIKNRKGNQEIWDFDKHMEAMARANDIEVLKMWNMTVQADSWDGMRFGEKVAITQAMMVINWLSRLESS